MREPWFHIVCELEEKSVPTIRDIQRAVCRRFDGVTLGDMLSPRRHLYIDHPRHVAMYLARKLTMKSFPIIGRKFDRTHKAPLRGFHMIEQRIKVDLPLAALVESIGQELGASA
jgi:chromosomal replication initiator protein